MIKAIITDVDGVFVGKKQGINFPLPNHNVITMLHTLQKKGIPVVICTAKFNYAVKEIILRADLRNPHITDGGAFIIDPLHNAIIKKYVFEKNLAHELVGKCLAEKIYTEVYGATEYFLQKDHISEFTEKRIQILQKTHIAVDSLIDHLAKIEVIKIINFAHTPQEKEKIENLLSPYKDKIHYVWSHHPKTFPSENTVVTVKGVSKKTASLEVLKQLNVTPDETLGVGDTMGDWNFMSLCKYVGVVGDTSNELKRSAMEKGEGNYFFGSSVDEDGFLQIVDHFFK